MKTTKQQFNFYKERFAAYAKEYGLTEWLIQYQHGTNFEDNLGECATNITNMTCITRLTKTWDEKAILDNDMIDRIAFHEVWELILAKLYDLSTYRFVTEDQLTGARHEIIRRMENIHWPEMKRRVQ